MATIDQSLERGLPAAPDAERSILGAILLDNDLATEATRDLQPDHFSLDAHRRIFARMCALHEDARPIDQITLLDELNRHKEVEAVGGITYLASLTDRVPRRTSIEHYIRIVRDKALMRSLIHVANGVMAQAMDGADGAAEVLDAAEQAILKVSDERGGQQLMNLQEVAQRAFGGNIEKLFERGGRITGLETHFADLDEMTSGLQPQELIIIAARPSMGKTAFAINIAENAAVQGGKKVAVFSLEMSSEALLQRMLCSQARVDSHKMRTGFLSREDRNKMATALESLMSAPMYIDDTPGISVTELRSKARRMSQTTGLDLIVIDYLQLMSASAPGGRRYENRTQEVSAISRGLKAIAKELRVPVIALSQLSRASETRGSGNQAAEPKLSDLRESGSIEQDADVVMFLYRPEYYNRTDPDLEGKAKLIVAKQRNGPTDTIQLAFIKASTRFETLNRADWLRD